MCHQYFSKHALIVSLKKGGITITKVLDESGHKPKKIWVDKGGEFNNFSIHDKENSIAAENLLEP